MTERKSWPFKDMAVGDKHCFPASLYGTLKLVSIAAHTYARQKGWKFKTRTVNPNTDQAYLEVTRVRSENDVAHVDGRTLRRVRYPFEDLEVGESCTLYNIEGERATSAVSKRHREGTKRWTVKRSWVQENVIAAVTITRVA